jgi:hypothetical protein
VVGEGEGLVGGLAGWLELEGAGWLAGLLTLALARTDGGMILSGPKACRGSMKEERILPHFLHSAGDGC